MAFDRLKNYLSVIRTDILNGYSDNKNALNSKQNKNLLDKQKKNVFELSKTIKNYSEILNKYAKLANDLGLEDSLEICILFTYLLWNGYFSVTKTHAYNDNNLASIEGAFAFDIMTGKGVCLNFSTMLRDFLLECGYNASNLINVDDKESKINYRIPVKRKYIKNKNINVNSTNHLISKIKSKKYGNHVFTLVKDGEYIYAYDPTNLLLLDIKNINVAKLVNGKGTYKLC